jgi:hypothetical protein
MAAQSNIIKLLQALSGPASESYGQGSFSGGRQGGQPILPKPTVSMPHAMSPYAPGNQNGGPHAILGAMQQGQMGGADSSVGGYAMTQPNRTQGAKPNQMGSFQPSHPVSQLASYLQTQGGADATAPGGLKIRRGVDAGAFLRGQQ